MKKKILLIFSLLVVLAVVGYQFIYHSHRDIATEEAAFSVSGDALIKEFVADENASNAKYLDKSVAIKGKITNVDALNNTFVLDEKVFAIVQEKNEAKVGDVVTVKGRLIGFDSLLEEIKLDQCTIQK